MQRCFCKGNGGMHECAAKVGVRNLSPHLRNSAILRTTKSIAELRTKKVAELRLRIFKLWLPQFRNYPQSPANSATFWYLFLAQDGVKNQPKIFLELSVSLEIKKTCLKETVARDFLPPIFFSWTPTGSYGQKYAENCGNEALKLRTSEKIAIAELRSCGCGATFL